MEFKQRSQYIYSNGEMLLWTLLKVDMSSVQIRFDQCFNFPRDIEPVGYWLNTSLKYQQLGKDLSYPDLVCFVVKMNDVGNIICRVDLCWFIISQNHYEDTSPVNKLNQYISLISDLETRLRARYQLLSYKQRFNQALNISE